MAEAPQDPVFPPVTISKDGEHHPPAGGGVALSLEELKDRVVVILAMKAQGATYQEITDKTGLSRRQIRSAMQRAHELKLAKAQAYERLDNVAVPLAVDGLIDILEDPEHANFYNAIRDTLYGRGEFRNHSHSVEDRRNVNLNMTVEYEAVGGEKLPDVVQVTEAMGMMVGKPREDDADEHAGRR